MEKSFINRRNFLQQSLAVSAVVAGGSSLAVGTANAPEKNNAFIENGPKTELFLDDEFLEMTASVTRRIHRPTKHPLNPLIKPEQWWEGESTMNSAAAFRFNGLR